MITPGRPRHRASQSDQCTGCTSPLTPQYRATCPRVTLCCVTCDHVGGSALDRGARSGRGTGHRPSGRTSTVDEVVATSPPPDASLITVFHDSIGRPSDVARGPVTVAVAASSSPAVIGRTSRWDSRTCSASASGSPAASTTAMPRR